MSFPNIASSAPAVHQSQSPAHPPTDLHLRDFHVDPSSFNPKVGGEGFGFDAETDPHTLVESW